MDERARTTPDSDSASSAPDPTPPSTRPSRRPPPMRVVTKGGWRMDEDVADIEQLRAERPHE
jgi:hypothetical protein